MRSTLALPACFALTIVPIMLMLEPCAAANPPPPPAPPPPPPIPSPTHLPLEDIKLPKGFNISLYTRIPVPGARQLALSTGKHARYPRAVIVYVGSVIGPGNVYALVDREGDRNITRQVILTDQFRPNGVEWRNGSLYVAEAGRITRYDHVDDYALAGKALPKGKVISSAFPAAQHIHQDHFIAFGPDGWLYVPQGAENNTGPCARWGDILHRCTINRMRADGSDLQTYARGVRNSVGFDWDPATGKLWAGVNERQLLPPDIDARPDDLLLHIPRAGLDFGFPFCHYVGKGSEYRREVGQGSIVLDDVRKPPGVSSVNDTAAFHKYCANATKVRPPALTLGPHAAPLGMRFYTGTMFPEKYRGTIFMAQHGSGSRKKALGYRIMNIGVNPNGTVSRYEVFAEGWLQDRNERRFFGRPVDVLMLRDGSLLVSDNYANVIYRIAYHQHE